MTTMVDVFVSPNQSSLFPFSCPDITKKDYDIFYRKDRELFTHLLVNLRREANQSKRVMGFFLWLEREGYTSTNISQNILDSLTSNLIDKVIDEAVICLKSIEKQENGFESDIWLLQKFLDRKSISLNELYENRDSIFEQVSIIVKNVCVKVFDDILRHFIIPKEVVLGGSFVPFCSHNVNKYVGSFPTALGFGGTNHDVHLYRSMAACGGENGNFVTPKIDLGLNQLYGLGHVDGGVQDEEEGVAAEDRTVFLTFSKGYPISETEVRDFFTRKFGDVIEEIYMQEVVGEEQALYARVVVRSRSMLRAVVESDGKTKYTINGKHVWARKYVKKTRNISPIRSTIEPLAATIAPPRP